MKKKTMLITLIIAVLLITGCSKKESKKQDWIIDMTDSKQILETDVEQIFKRAKSNNNSNLECIALLARQIVAGTNYMFLCKDENSYKIAVVYNNLENISQIISVSDFNPIKYVNENYELDNEKLSGSWNVVIPEKTMMLSEKIQKYFDKATNTLTGRTIFPIAVLAHQNKNGTNYGILCYGEESYKGSATGIFMTTLYIDETDKPEIVSIAAINPRDYSK